MADLSLPTIATQLRQAALLRAGVVGGLSDGQLLARFIDQHDEVAFAALVQRHGPMVLGTCRRVLGNAHDADDAFQATFPILVHKAASLASREQVGSWLYGVAFRTALAARAAGKRRGAREMQVSEMPEPPAAVAPPADDDLAELRRLLDQELNRLAATQREA